MTPAAPPTHVSLVAVPDVLMATLAGLHDVFNCFGALAWFDESLARRPPFQVDIVSAGDGPVTTANGITLPPQRPINDVRHSDIVILPSTLVAEGRWHTGRSPELVAWLGRMHDAGARVCSACSGTLLLAETGLLDGREATMHWAYADTFRRNFPRVKLRLEKALLVEGEHGQFVMSGAASSWNDLALYLIASHLNPAAAQAVAKFFAFQWHADGMAPYAVFEPPLDHGDAAVHQAQEWIAEHPEATSPVEAMIHCSGLATRSFKRRFRKATGYSAIRYVQELRIDRAKRALELGTLPVDEIAWQVGYEDPAFFRRLFRRIAGISPRDYRRKFRVPDFTRP